MIENWSLVSVDSGYEERVNEVGRDRTTATKRGYVMVTCRARLSFYTALLLLSLPASTVLAQPESDFEELTVEPMGATTETEATEEPDEGAIDEDEPSAQDWERDQSLSAAFALRLQELEDRINDLKEQIFRSKSRLVLLRERVLRAAIGGSQAIINHVNDMSVTFEMRQVIYSLDGNAIFSLTDMDGSLSDEDSIEIYNGAILPGPHNLAVEMIFVGNGYGLFSYLEGWRFRLRSSYAFTAEDGKVAELQVIAYEQGGVNQPIEERPDIRYELEYLDSVLTDDLGGE